MLYVFATSPLNMQGLFLLNPSEETGNKLDILTPEDLFLFSILIRHFIVECLSMPASSSAIPVFLGFFVNSEITQPFMKKYLCNPSKIKLFWPVFNHLRAHFLHFPSIPFFHDAEYGNICYCNVTKSRI